MKKYYEKDEKAEKEIAEMKSTFETEEFEEKYIRELIGKQKGELNVKSKYYEGNIAEGNWSMIEEDSDIEKLDEKKKDDKLIDAMDVLLGLDKYSEREHDAEYEYVYIPSYYAVKTLILYYIINRKEAQRIYGLKNAVVRRKGEKFYGGLPFILKYEKILLEDSFIKSDFKAFVEKIRTYKDKSNNLDNNFIDDEFLKDIIDCIKNA